MKKLATLLLVLLWPALVLGEMTTIPVWTQTQCGKDTMACYTFEQAKGLLQLDLDLQLKFKECEVCQLNLTDTKKALDDSLKAQGLLKENVTRLELRNTEKQATLDDVLVKYKRAEESSIWSGGVLPYVIGTIILVGAGGFVGGMIFGHSL